MGLEPINVNDVNECRICVIYFLFFSKKLIKQDILNNKQSR